MQKTLRVVLAGCGGISQAWLKPAVEIPNLQIVGLVDLRPENAQQRAIQFGLKGVETGSDLGAILDHTQPDILFDCTVPEAHVDVTLEALGRGIHVLGEKPMADNMPNARRMVAKAQETGKLYAVMQNRRYQAEIRSLRDFFSTGAIGPLTTANSDFYLAPHFGGFRDQMQHVLLVDMAIHTFDQARFLTGADPEAVYCKEWNPSGSWYAHGASAVCVFEMTGGLVYTYRGSWCAEGLPTSWESEWRLTGTHGTVLWDGGLNHRAESAAHPAAGFWAERTPQEIPAYRGEKTGGHAGLIQDFIECVRRGKIPETICTDNIQSLAMVYAALESTAGQTRVEVLV
jgi:predicted dehydrogenase